MVKRCRIPVGFSISLGLLLLLMLPFNTVSATDIAQQHVRIASDPIQLWFAVVAMGSLVLLGVVWIVWPERRHQLKSLEA